MWRDGENTQGSFYRVECDRLISLYDKKLIGVYDGSGVVTWSSCKGFHCPGRFWKRNGKLILVDVDILIILD